MTGLRSDLVFAMPFSNVLHLSFPDKIMGWTVPAPQWKNTGRNREWCDDDYNDRT